MVAFQGKVVTDLIKLLLIPTCCPSGSHPLSENVSNSTITIWLLVAKVLKVLVLNSPKYPSAELGGRGKPKGARKNAMPPLNKVELRGLMVREK